MSNTKKSEKAADMIDPKATAPSNNPDKTTPTAAEPNSTQRVGKKVSRTGKNNDGDGDGDGDNRGRPGLNTDLTADSLGEREAVRHAATDVIWTSESKDRWGNGQPDLADLLAQRDKINKVQVENEDK